MQVVVALFCLLAASVSAKTVTGPASSNVETVKPTLKEVFKWKVVDFDFESGQERSKAISERSFIPENNVPVGLEVWENKVFLTIPRWKKGVPASLAYVDKDSHDESPVLKPYPNWGAHKLNHTNSERIVSPFRVQADSCNRLWVLDTGVDGILTNNVSVLSRPQIIVYELTKDKRIRNYTIPLEQTNPAKSFFANIAVDVVTCEETYAYLADLSGALVVYDWKKNRSWMIRHQSFMYNEKAKKFNVNGVKFSWEDGIFGMALSESDDEDQRTMYYHAFSSFDEYKVSTKLLRNESAAAMIELKHEGDFVKLGSRGEKSQASASFSDPNTGAVFYTQVNRNAIACFNYRQDHTYFSDESTDVIAMDNETMVFPNDLTVVDGDLWVISDRMAEFVMDKFNPNRINFRVFKGNAHEMIQDTKCASSAWTSTASMLMAVWLPLMIATLMDCESIYLYRIKMTASLKRFFACWKTMVVFVMPILLSPLLVSEPIKECRCAYVVILMSIYWMTEAVPLPITSLLPVILFPLLGVMGTEEVCISYLKETNMMFIGGIIVAIAVEHSNLHKRIALRVTLVFGTSPMRIMLGFMVTTMILSMWISNTATTAMMVPIVQAVLDELNSQREHESGGSTRRRSLQMVQLNSLNGAEQSGGGGGGSGAGDEGVKPAATGDGQALARPTNEAVGYYLGVAYASNLGGAGTLTGTGTNLTFKGLYESIFPDAEGVNFASWMIFNVPLMLVNVLAACIWLQYLFLGLFRKKTVEQKKSKEHEKAVGKLIREKYEELGPMSFHEASTLVLFILVVLLWFFREPEFIPGWAKLISTANIKDATPVMLIVFLLFVLPANFDFLHSGRGPPKTLLHWKIIHEKVPWGLVLLLGGGFAMASASKASGLSRLLGEKLVALEVFPPFVIMMIISTATTFITEVSSNTAVANIVLPVLAEMACAMRLHPLYLMIPAVLCCSYAFMLPVSTPPNAIVLSASNMRTTDMMKAGFGMNIICLAILFVFFPLLGTHTYNLSEFPAYAMRHYNLTANMTL